MSQIFYSIIVLVGFSWIIYNQDFAYPSLKNEYFYENLSRHQHAVISQNIRLENFDTWPKTASLQLDSWNSETSVASLDSKPRNSPSKYDDLLMECFAAISAGIFSTAVGLMMISASGVLLSWM